MLGAKMLNFLIETGVTAPIIIVVEAIIVYLFINSIVKKHERLPALLIWNTVMLSTGFLGFVLGLRGGLDVIVETMKTIQEIEYYLVTQSLIGAVFFSLHPVLLVTILFLINILLYAIVRGIINKRNLPQN